MKSLVPGIIALLLEILNVAVCAAPLPQLAPVTVEGTIIEAEWEQALKLEGRPGMSGTFGVDRTIPAHFFVSLADFRIMVADVANRGDAGNMGSETAMAWKMNWYWGKGPEGTTDRTQPPQYLWLRLNHNDPDALRKGMRIRVTGYSVAGDEGGTWTRYKAIEVLNCGVGANGSNGSKTPDGKQGQAPAGSVQ